MSRLVPNHKKRPLPGSLDFDSEKLYLMQENLKLAAETINSLKKERDFFKNSSRTLAYDDRSTYPERPETDSQIVLKSELSTLKSLTMQKDKNLEILKKKLKIHKINIKRLHEDNTKLSKISSEKEEQLKKSLEKIDFLEKTLEDLKSTNDSLKTDSIEKSLKIQEMVKEKNNFFSLFESIFLEQLKKAPEEHGKSAWEKLVTRSHIIKSVLTEQQKVVEDLQKQNKNKAFFELEQVSKELRKELDKLKSSQKKEAIFEEIQESAIEFIELAHSTASWHNSFKDLFVSPKTVQYLIENFQYGDLLLKCFRFLASVNPKQAKFYSHKPSKSTQSLCLGENALEQNCWTQTSEVNSPRVTHFGLSSPSSSTKLISNKSTQIKSKSNSSIVPAEHNEEDLSSEAKKKIVKESQQLFNLIDKQNSRLARINSQISQLVPNLSDRPVPNHSESSVIINEETNNSKNEVQGRKYTNRHKTSWESPVVISIKPGVIYREREKVKKSYKDAESIRLRSPPRACSPEEKPLDDSYCVRSESDEVRIEKVTPKSEKKRSAWDLSALKIPPKEDDLIDKKIEVVNKVVSPKEPRKNSKSPDANLNRFNEYARPKFKKEGTWGSVADYFSGRYEESKLENV